MSMKLAFISDLHGCLNALNAVLSDAADRGADAVYCLGDVVDMGPNPGAVVDRLRSSNIETVRGNHDTLDEHPEIPFLKDLESWTEQQLSAEQLTWLSDLPLTRLLEVEGKRLLLTHGAPHSNTVGLVAETPANEIENWLDEANASIVLAGHTHVPLVRHVRNGVAINVGSTCMPFSAAEEIPPLLLPFSDYAMLDIGESVAIQQIRIPLDLAALAQEVADCRMPHSDALIGGYST